MALGVCIPDLIDQGAIPPERAERVSNWYDRRVEELRGGGLGREAAEAQATTDTLNWLKADVRHKQRNALTQQRIQGEWHGQMMREAGEGPPSITGVRDRMLEVFRHAEVVSGRLFQSLDGFVARYRKNLANFNWNRAELDDIGRALWDKAGGDEAAQVMARSIADTVDLARTMFNAAGGRIGRLEGDAGYIPTLHDWRSLDEMGFGAWRAHPAIENVRVVHPETGVEAVGLQRETVLEQIYETIRSDGKDGMTLGQQGSRALANRRADPRVMHFASYDDWLAYHQKFGLSDNIYDVFTGHLKSMARDIALMERMGPNPAATLRFVQDDFEALMSKRGSIRQRQRIGRQRKSLERVYGELSGKHLHPADENIANAGSFVRAMNVASHLGSAMISAISDIGTTMRTAQFNKVPMMRVVSQYVADIARGENASREALRAGLYVQDYIGHVSSMARFTGEEVSSETARVLSDAVIRSTFLARHTRKMGWAWGKAHRLTLTRNASKSWNDLHPQMRAQMERYDIGKTDWDAYRATSPSEDPGQRGDIMPFEVEDQTVGNKFQSMILGETDFAIFTKSHRVAAAFNGRFERGDPFGEAARFGYALKNFPIGIIALHGRRTLEQPGLAGKVGYAVPLFLYMTALGALSVQLYNIATGKDPQEMLDEDGNLNKNFLMRAIVRGGGASVLGDLFGDPRMSTGDAMVSYMAGPIYSGAFDAAADAKGNFEKLAAGEETEFAADALDNAKDWVPGQNIWWHRLATSRAIEYYIEREVNPDAETDFLRTIQRSEEEGSPMWWENGEIAPSRAPDLSNALPE